MKERKRKEVERRKERKKERRKERGKERKKERNRYGRTGLDCGHHCSHAMGDYRPFLGITRKG